MTGSLKWNKWRGGGDVQMIVPLFPGGGGLKLQKPSTRSPRLHWDTPACPQRDAPSTPRERSALYAVAWNAFIRKINRRPIICLSVMNTGCKDSAGFICLEIDEKWKQLSDLGILSVKKHSWVEIIIFLHFRRFSWILTCTRAKQLH